jgi:hypothetical protein
MNLIYFAYGFLALTGLGIFVSIRNVIRAYQSNNWPKVKGEIIASEVEDDKSFQRPRYRPFLKYRYIVMGTTYENDNYNFILRWHNSKDQVISLLNQYPLGAKVDVYYKPIRPSISVLVPRVKPVQFLLLAACLFFFFGCIYVLVTQSGPTEAVTLKKWVYNLLNPN